MSDSEDYNESLENSPNGSDEEIDQEEEENEEQDPSQDSKDESEPQVEEEIPIQLSPLWELAKQFSEETNPKKRYRLVRDIVSSISKGTQEGAEDDEDNEDEEQTPKEELHNSCTITKGEKTYICFLDWVVDHELHEVAEKLISQGRGVCGFKQGKDLHIFDRYMEEVKTRQEQEKEEEEQSGHESDEEEEEPKPEIWDVLGEELDIHPLHIKRIGKTGIYEGEYDENQNRCGVGATLFSNGDVYLGNYENNLRQGKGIYIHYSQAKEDEVPFYIGGWSKSLRSGLGFQLYSGGNKYRGEWKNGKREGKGTIWYSNGDTFSGSWLQDKRHGTGRYLFSLDRSEYTGVWKKGKFVSGIWHMSNGVLLSGSFFDQPLGEGKFTFTNGSKLYGHFGSKGWELDHVE